MPDRRCFAFLLVGILFLAGCAVTSQTTPPTETLLPAATSTLTMQPSQTVRPPLPSRTTRPTPTASVTPLPTSGLCAPLEDVPFTEMTEILQVPMQTPHPGGQDDGHHGSDFAFYRFGQRANMEGLDIFSVLNGTVVSNVPNRKPYGNMIMVETPLELLPTDLLQALNLPDPVPAIAPDSRMAACSPETPSLDLDFSQRSLYVLYAHLIEPSPLEPGEMISCGQHIGDVGNTGMSGNPHLHLELRVGPSGARFPSMAYYDTGATLEEFNTYCTWRVSQIFQIVEPMLLVGAGAAR